MKATISSKGRIVLPAELRNQNGIQPGQEFEIERPDLGVYCLKASEPPKNRGFVDLLLACPEKDWFSEIASEFIGCITPPEGLRVTGTGPKRMGRGAIRSG